MNKIYLLATFLFFNYSFFSQTALTANDFIHGNESPFQYGIQIGGHQGWKEHELVNLAIGHPALGLPGLGVTALRIGLGEDVLEEWGYDFKLADFKSYANRGIVNNIAILGYPTEAHRSDIFHCRNHRSELFANLYEPIWDEGEQGTPVNDNNYYALYVYKLVSQYKDFIRFYEVWNAPDFPRANFLVQLREDPRNWWNNNPNPCDYELRAPIFYYIRMLRITYEVVKRFDPDGLVSIGTLRHPAFLDAILRNTDEPNFGLLSNDFPLKGGAYFDVLHFQAFPHYDGSLQTWNNTTKQLDFKRHSDAAVAGLIQTKENFEQVLQDYGYGAQYPSKRFSITSTNIPRKPFQNYIGSYPAQINYIIKALVEAQRNGIEQLHLYQLGSYSNFGAATNEFQLMGAFGNLQNLTPYNQELTSLGIAYKTTAELLFGKTYDAAKTSQLNLPEGTTGAAFRDEHGDFIYVLWANTKFDQIEFASASINLETSLGVDSVVVKTWEYTQNKERQTIASEEVLLNATPIFVTTLATEEKRDTINFSPNIIKIFPNPFFTELNIRVQLEKADQLSIAILNRFGTLVSEVINTTSLTAGVHEYHLDTSTWAAGNYFLQVHSAQSGQVIWVNLVKLLF